MIFVAGFLKDFDCEFNYLKILFENKKIQKYHAIGLELLCSMCLSLEDNNFVSIKKDVLRNYHTRILTSFRSSILYFRIWTCSKYYMNYEKKQHSWSTHLSLRLLINAITIETMIIAPTVPKCHRFYIFENKIHVVFIDWPIAMKLPTFILIFSVDILELFAQPVRIVVS